jgi:putative FmdB family regulatory protein
MPTYEYACRDCGQHVELVQSFSEDPLTVCPRCGGEMRKVFAPVGIVLKGSGFYKNDSRSSNGRGAGKGSTESKESSTSPAESNTSDGKDSSKKGDGAGSTSSNGSTSEKASSEKTPAATKASDKS